MAHAEATFMRSRRTPLLAWMTDASCVGKNAQRKVFDTAM